jgi:hypothetical protein
MEETRATKAATSAAGARTYTGGCHCGAVRFEVMMDPGDPAGRCNCSICTKVGALGAIVVPDAFTLVKGEESLGVYEWGAKISRRSFCKRCGVHCFGRGHLAEVGGDYVSVNLNCLEGVELKDLPVVHWDGRHDNWTAGPRSTPWPVLAPAAG